MIRPRMLRGSLTRRGGGRAGRSGGGITANKKRHREGQRSGEPSRGNRERDGEKAESRHFEISTGAATPAAGPRALSESLSPRAPLFPLTVLAATRSAFSFYLDDDDLRNPEERRRERKKIEKKKTLTTLHKRSFSMVSRS